MTETQLTRRIRDRVHKRGGMSYKLHGGPYMEAGVPDLIIVYRGNVLFAEVKVPGNSPTLHQSRQLNRLAGHGAMAMVVRTVEEIDYWLDEMEEQADATP